MSEKHNIYYSPEKFDLEIFSIDQSGLSYEYNTLCFWATKDGEIYSISDSGCSCPTPFEQYDSYNQKEAIQKLEHIKDSEHAIQTFKDWYGYKECDCSEESLRNWIEEHIKNGKKNDKDKKGKDKKIFMEFVFETGKSRRLEIRKVTSLSEKADKIAMHVDKLSDGYLLIINDAVWNTDIEKLNSINIVRE